MERVDDVRKGKCQRVVIDDEKGFKEGIGSMPMETKRTWVRSVKGKGRSMCRRRIHESAPD